MSISELLVSIARQADQFFSNGLPLHRANAVVSQIYFDYITIFLGQSTGRSPSGSSPQRMMFRRSLGRLYMPKSVYPLQQYSTCH